MSDWGPVGKEAHLLDAYHQENGGRMYTEVPVAWSETHGEWPSDSNYLRIDAIRLLDSEYDDEIWQAPRRKKEVLKHVEDSSIELIEVKPKLNRSVIGQAIVGRDMVRKDYRPSEIQAVVVCENVNTALEPACEKYDIQVEICEPTTR